MFKAGIMGGTFNPVHNAHLMLAEQAYEQLGLDKIIFIPSKNPPHKNNADIVMIKGFGTGIASLIIAFMFDNRINGVFYVLLALVLGFLSYGLSILFYIKAQRRLGAAKTSTYYAITPFLGVLFSLIIFSQMPNISLIIALIIMMFAAYFAYTDKV